MGEGRQGACASAKPLPRTAQVVAETRARAAARGARRVRARDRGDVSTTVPEGGTAYAGTWLLRQTNL